MMNIFLQLSLSRCQEQVEISLEDYRDKMPESKIRCVENYLKLINSEKKYVDEYNKTHPNFKTYKIGDVLI